MSNIQIFNHPKFGDIRTAGTADEPMFCLSDICKAVGIANARNVKSRLDEEDVRLVDTPTNGGIQQLTFVTESGLYETIIRSDSEAAKPFRKWVTSEVLPTIRKHGAYMDDKTIERTLTDPDYLIQLATTLKDERRARQEAEERAARLLCDNQQKDEKIKEDAPKVIFADAITGSKSSILIGQLAKTLTQNGYKIGQNRLFAWLRDNHYLGSYGSYYNIPYQVYIEQGLFEVKYTSHSEGASMVTSATPKVTGKGQQYFINLFLGRS